jgi:hypothetical protein
VNYRLEVFVEQLPLVDLFVKHLIHHRSLKPWLARTKVKSSFWSDTSNAHLLQAVIYWCKVFGSDGANPTHWKKLSPGDCEEIQKSFRAGLYSSLRVTPAEWLSYWEEVLSFRNKYVAHHELEHSQPVPILDRALELAFYYDDWIRKAIAPDILYEKPLRELVEQLRHDVEEELSAAMQAFVVEHISTANSQG